MDFLMSNYTSLKRLVKIFNAFITMIKENNTNDKGITLSLNGFTDFRDEKTIKKTFFKKFFYLMKTSTKPFHVRDSKYYLFFICFIFFKQI